MSSGAGAGSGGGTGAGAGAGSEVEVGAGTPLRAVVVLEATRDATARLVVEVGEALTSSPGSSRHTWACEGGRAELCGDPPSPARASAMALPARPSTAADARSRRMLRDAGGGVMG